MFFCQKWHKLSINFEFLLVEMRKVSDIPNKNVFTLLRIEKWSLNQIQETFKTIFLSFHHSFCGDFLWTFPVIAMVSVRKVYWTTDKVLYGEHSHYTPNSTHTQERRDWLSIKCIRLIVATYWLAAKSRSPCYFLLPTPQIGANLTLRWICCLVSQVKGWSIRESGLAFNSVSGGNVCKVDSG